MRSDTEQEHPGTTADLHQSLRSTDQDPADSLFYLLAHFVSGERLTGITTVPPYNIERAFLHLPRRSVEVIVEHLPLLNMLLFPGLRVVFHLLSV